MRREHLQSLLEQYTPSDEEDSACKTRFLSFVRQQARCFDRGLEVGHVTASAWLLNADMSRALLVHHRKLNRWVQPGGHCESDDADVLAAAIREAQEESGIACIEAARGGIYDIDIHRFPATDREPAHDHYDVRFLLRVCHSGQEVACGPECHALRWVGMEERDLPTNEPSVVRLLKKWKLLSGALG
jgi:8-oxo-dGTP pyrophosphatase MutT (NUDIX family)